MNIYLALCGIIFTILSGNAIWSDLKYGPKEEIGYHCINPMVLSIVFLSSIPFINIVFVIGMLSLIIHNKRKYE